jgi:hypothetical protein
MFVDRVCARAEGAVQRRCTRRAPAAAYHIIFITGARVSETLGSRGLHAQPVARAAANKTAHLPGWVGCAGAGRR